LGSVLADDPHADRRLLAGRDDTSLGGKVEGGNWAVVLAGREGVHPLASAHFVHVDAAFVGRDAVPTVGREGGRGYATVVTTFQLARRGARETEVVELGRPIHAADQYKGRVDIRPGDRERPDAGRLPPGAERSQVAVPRVDPAVLGRGDDHRLPRDDADDNGANRLVGRVLIKRRAGRDIARDLDGHRITSRNDVDVLLRQVADGPEPAEFVEDDHRFLALDPLAFVLEDLLHFAVER